MRKSRAVLFFFLGMTIQAAIGQPATFENGILSIPQGATIANGEPAYYTDIQLASDSEGNFRLLAAEQSNLVNVDNIVISIAESFPVQVILTIAGNKSVPCVELQAPAVFRTDFAFTVVLAETTLGPAESCIAVIEPFESTLMLDTADLESGTYSVSVNGVEASFNL